MKNFCILACGGQLFVRSHAKATHSVPVWSEGNLTCLWFYHTQIATTTSPHENQSYYAKERPVQISAGHSFVNRVQSQSYDGPQRITAKIFVFKSRTWTLDICFIVAETMAHRLGEFHAWQTEDTEICWIFWDTEHGFGVFLDDRLMVRCWKQAGEQTVRRCRSAVKKVRSEEGWAALPLFPGRPRRAICCVQDTALCLLSCPGL